MIPLTHDGLLKFFDTFSSNEVNAAPPYSRYSPQETAPEDLKQLFKLWKSSNRSGGRIDDLKLPLPFPSCIPEVTLQKAFGQFMGNSLHAPKDGLGEVDEASDLTISALEHSMVSQFGCGSAFESTKIPGRKHFIHYKRHSQGPFFSRGSAGCFHLTITRSCCSSWTSDS
jgi:hypothetical protein